MNVGVNVLTANIKMLRRQVVSVSEVSRSSKTPAKRNVFKLRYQLIPVFAGMHSCP